MPSLPLPLTLGGWIFALLGLLIVPTHGYLSIRAAATAEEEEEEEVMEVEEGSGEDLEKGVEGAGGWRARLREAFRPNASWGPSSIQERRAWGEYKWVIHTTALAHVGTVWV